MACNWNHLKRRRTSLCNSVSRDPMPCLDHCYCLRYGKSRPGRQLQVIFTALHIIRKNLVTDSIPIRTCSHVGRPAWRNLQTMKPFQTRLFLATSTCQPSNLTQVSWESSESLFLSVFCLQVQLHRFLFSKMLEQLASVATVLHSLSFTSPTAVTDALNQCANVPKRPVCCVTQVVFCQKCGASYASRS